LNCIKTPKLKTKKNSVNEIIQHPTRYPTFTRPHIGKLPSTGKLIAFGLVQALERILNDLFQSAVNGFGKLANLGLRYQLECGSELSF